MNQSKQSSFDPIAVMKRAVAREIKRKKALKQYIVIMQQGKIKKIQF